MTEPAKDTDNSEQDVALARDRRRPGRVNYSNPHLLNLLRRHTQQDVAFPEVGKAEAHQGANEGWSHDLDAARGIGLSVLIGIVLWLALIWSAFHWL